MKSLFAFSRTNFVLLAIGMAAVVIGYCLMSGPGSTETQFQPDIFSALRVKVAPACCFLGYVFMIFAVLYKGREE